MEERRKIAGRRIKRARLHAGYRSQRAFADAIGIHETTLSRAESGDSRVGEATFVAIEGGLKWPDDCITRYLETGDESLLPSIGRPGQAEEEPEPEPPAAPSLADQMKAVRDELLLIAEERQRLAEREEAALHRAEELLVESGEPPERRGEPTERRVG